MNVLSTFNGYGSIWLALDRLGITVNKRYSSEIDKYANSINNFNYPDTIQLGDVTKINGYSLPNIDLLVGGSPCQGFSFAGKQLNFDDPRSKLFFEFVRLLKETNPKYFLLENVVMKQEYQDVISEHLGVKPIEINSSLVSAQNRRRLYWTNIPDISLPIDKGIVWGDVREFNVSDESFYYSDKAMQWIARHSQRKNKILTIHSIGDKMQMLEASHHKKYSSQRFFGVIDKPNNIEKIENKYYIGKVIPENLVNIVFDNESNRLNTIDINGNIVHLTSKDSIGKEINSFIRYITPIECERLQTVPDDYTKFHYDPKGNVKIMSNSQRYKMLGNGWTIDIISHILNNIN